MARNSTTMNISMPANLRAFVEEMVTEGEYASASSVLQDAVRLLQKQREMHRLKVERLRAAIMVGVRAEQEGRVLTREDFTRSGKALLENLAAQSRKDREK